MCNSRYIHNNVCKHWPLISCMQMYVLLDVVLCTWYGLINWNGQVLLCTKKCCKCNSSSFVPPPLPPYFSSVPLQQLLDNCRTVRERAQAILNPGLRTHVGAYGNSDPRNITQWVPILSSNLPETDLEVSNITKVDSWSVVRNFLYTCT